MKLGTHGLMSGFNNQNFVRSGGVPAKVVVVSPKRLSTATNMQAPKPRGAGNNSGALRGSLTHGKSGGVIAGK